MIKEVPKEFKDYYKYLFIANYFENLFNIKQNKLDIKRVTKFKSDLKAYYNDVKFSKSYQAKRR